MGGVCVLRDPAISSASFVVTISTWAWRVWRFDDGSTDGTFEFLSALSKRAFPRLGNARAQGHIRSAGVHDGASIA